MKQPSQLRQRRRRTLKGLSFNRLIPNILTLVSLCAGLTAMRFGFDGKWKLAVLAILIAAILDGLDGRIARILKGASKFGAELDSLADFVSFGVAPAAMLYLWTMKDAGRFGWILVLLFSVCCVLRLARFNTLLEEPDLPPWAHNFFAGVPAPMGAGLVLLPMILSFQIEAGFFNHSVVVGVFLVVVSALLVSRIPTFSFKRFKVPNPWVLPTMLIVGLLAALLVTAPWITMSLILILYIASFPFSIRSYRQLALKAQEAQHAATGEMIEANKEPGPTEGQG